MHLLKPLASFFVASAFTNASMLSNLPKPSSESLAAGNSAVETCVGQVHKLATAYGSPVWEKAEKVTHNSHHTPPFICHRLLMSYQAAQWSAENPGSAAWVVVGAGGALAVAAPGIVSAPILSSAGFAATGVTASECLRYVHAPTCSSLMG